MQRSFGRGVRRFTVLSGLVGLVMALLTFGCAPAPEADTADATAAVQPEPLVLPISLNEVMVALVNDAADPIWVAAWHQPESEKDWRELERRATQLELGGALLSIPGTGPVDQEWVAQEGWQDWAKQLRQAGAQALSAAQSRNIESISSAGDRIVEVCEGCHADFKPDFPTGGQFGELSPTADDLEDKE